MNDADTNSVQQDATGNDEDHVQRNISESADKIRVETRVKRGTGTRDEDQVKVKVKGDNPDTVVRMLNETVARLEQTGETLRDFQPGDKNE